MHIDSVPELYISHSLVRESQQHSGRRVFFKNAIVGLIEEGHKVAAFEKTTAKPSVVFEDSDSFIAWYENFSRIQGWFVKEY